MFKCPHNRWPIGETTTILNVFVYLLLNIYGIHCLYFHVCIIVKF